MKNFFLIISIIFLIVITTVTKNSTKKIENTIFSTKENISALKDKYEFVLLKYSIFSSPEKLLEYQSKYFEEDLISVDVNKIKKINTSNNNLIIKNFNKKKSND